MASVKLQHTLITLLLIQFTSKPVYSSIRQSQHGSRPFIKSIETAGELSSPQSAPKSAPVKEITDKLAQNFPHTSRNELVTKQNYKFDKLSLILERKLESHILDLAYYQNNEFNRNRGSKSQSKSQNSIANLNPDGTNDVFKTEDIKNGEDNDKSPPFNWHLSPRNRRNIVDGLLTLLPFPRRATNPVSNKPLVLANAKTVNGRAIANGQSRRGGVVISSSIANGQGNATAQAFSTGGIADGKNAAMASANAVRGGTVFTGAGSDSVVPDEEPDVEDSTDGRALTQSVNKEFFYVEERSRAKRYIHNQATLTKYSLDTPISSNSDVLRVKSTKLAGIEYNIIK